MSNITNGMRFGDFTIESGSGTITLNGGGARTAGGAVTLVSAGSAVYSHQIEVSNRGGSECATHGISFDWTTDPASTPMTKAGGNDIPMSNALLYIPGEAGSPFTLPTPVLYIDPALFPLKIQITAQMDTAYLQTAGSYRSNRYTLTLFQGTGSKNRRGRARTTSIVPLSLTPGVPMNFDQIASGSAGGSIILNATSGVRTATGNADVVSNAVAGTPGSFTIQGDAGLTFNISYVNGSLTDAAGGNPMILNSFTDTTAGLTLTGGADAFTVGATLNLNGSQPAGNYSTANPGGIPYSITVNYN